jgi:hypothetical protein
MALIRGLVSPILLTQEIGTSDHGIKTPIEGIPRASIHRA